MRALVWHGKQDIRCDSVPDPRIEQPRDAIIRVTSCAICEELHGRFGIGHATLQVEMGEGAECRLAPEHTV